MAVRTRVLSTADAQDTYNEAARRLSRRHSASQGTEKAAAPGTASAALTTPATTPNKEPGSTVLSPPLSAAEKGNVVVAAAVDAVDDAGAVGLLREAAELGHSAAQFRMGVLSLHGDRGLGVGRSPSNAIHFFRAAALQGHPEAQANLGSCFDRGVGVAKSEAEAASWWRRAADQGSRVVLQCCCFLSAAACSTSQNMLNARTRS